MLAMESGVLNQHTLRWMIVQHLFANIVKPARNKRDSRQANTHVDNLLFQLVDDMLSVWNMDSFLDRAQELVKKAIDKPGRQNTLLQSLTGVAQLKKERRQEDDSVNR